MGGSSDVKPTGSVKHQAQEGGGSISSECILKSFWTKSMLNQALVKGEGYYTQLRVAGRGGAWSSGEIETIVWNPSKGVLAVVCSGFCSFVKTCLDFERVCWKEAWVKYTCAVRKVNLQTHL